MSQRAALPLKWRLWPGLARLWFRGDVGALVEAVAFGALVDFWLVATFHWTAWIDPRFWWPATLLLTAWWIRGHWQSSRPDVLRSSARQVDEQVQLERLQETQQAWLTDQWNEAERLLKLMLIEDPRDALASLMLAKTYRYGDRLADAAQQLSRLAKRDEAAALWPEIQAEQRLIDQWLEAEPAQVSNEGVSPVAESTAAGHDALIDQVFTEETAFESESHDGELSGFDSPRIPGDGRPRSERNDGNEPRDGQEWERDLNIEFPGGEDADLSGYDILGGQQEVSGGQDEVVGGTGDDRGSTDRDSSQPSRDFDQSLGSARANRARQEGPRRSGKSQGPDKQQEDDDSKREKSSRRAA